MVSQTSCLCADWLKEVLWCLCSKAASPQPTGPTHVKLFLESSSHVGQERTGYCYIWQTACSSYIHKDVLPRQPTALGNKFTPYFPCITLQILSKSVNRNLGFIKRNLLRLMEQKNIIFHEDIYTLCYYNLNYVFRFTSMAVLCYNIKQFKMGLYAKLQI